MPSSLRTIAVLGASYGGAKAAQVLASAAPSGWRVVLIDRNTHSNHVYIFPRLSVLPGHEHKAFIPTTNVFRLNTSEPHPHLFLNTEVVGLSPTHLTLSSSFTEHGIESNVLPYDYLVYALGAQMPGVLDLWDHNPGGIPRPVDGPRYNGSKQDGIQWLKDTQKIIEDRENILVVGGGALGVQFATDIKSVHPEKTVTLLHSRDRVLPRFDEAVHYEITKVLDELDIKFVRGQRLDMSTLLAPAEKGNHKIVKTQSGLELSADLVLLCTGQKPNTQLLSGMDPLVVNPDNSRAKVLRSMQITRDVPQDGLALGSLSLDQSDEAEKPADKEQTAYPHIFAIGDAADAFGAIQAGHTAHYQALVATENILRLIKQGSSTSEPIELDSYKPTDPAIKISLGMRKSVYQSGGAVGTKDDGKDDLGAASMWPFFGATAEKEEDMFL